MPTQNRGQSLISRVGRAVRNTATRVVNRVTGRRTGTGGGGGTGRTGKS